MRRATRIERMMLACMVLGLSVGLARAAERPWEKLYTGADAVGDKVVALWQFQPGAELEDRKGQAALTLRGKARILKDERFGGALESFCSGKDFDKPHGASTQWKLDLTPTGALTLEAWVKLKADPSDPKWRSGYIIDKMYVPNTHESSKYNKDYFFRINRVASGKTCVLHAGIGLGAEVITFQSQSIPATPGIWRHLAFTYDGKGTGMFFVDGDFVGRKDYPGKGPSVGGTRNVALGERCGSHHSGLPAYLAQVRIYAGIPDFLSGPVEVVVAHPHQRTVFERLEKGHTLAVTVRNSTGRTVKDLLLDVDTGLERIQKKLGDFGEETRTVSVPLRCDGKAGAYALTATVTGNLGDRRAEWRGTLNWHLVNRLPTFMPVAMWGGASFEQMEQCGFTHSLQWMDHVDMQAWKAGEPLGFIPRFDETRTMLNETLLRGLRVLGKMSPGGYFKHQKAYAKHRQPHLCQDVHGKPIEKAVDFAQPRVQQWGYDVGRSIFNNVGMFPAVDLFLTDSEFRDSGRVSYRPEIRAAFKKHAGYDIPKLVRAKTGVRHKEIPNFPRDRIVPDDDRILTFYRWFWGGGDGYPGMISRERDGVKGDREDLHPFWDPAVRCPSKWGSGGRTDIISQWTYVYPDPLVMGMATDELFAMVKGGPEYQKVMKMTQVIWYRSGTTGPLPKDKSKWTEWEKRLPDTKFITIPPDMLEIALWQKIARPIRGIQYHGSGSLWPSKPGGYDYTNSETAPRLAKLTSTIIKPLGPMLLAVPDRPAKVAMLESFTSQMFYGGATSGSMRGPVGRMHAVLYRAHLQPEIVYDETIQRDGLDPFDVLVAPYCGVLCESVARKIEVWQSRGGVLVADEDLTPRLMPDILIEKCGSSEKSELVEKARALRAELETVYTPHGDADTPDAILRFRKYGSTDYLFALNDRRTYGTYVGQYRRVMEKGQPLDATLTVRRPRGVVYDLVAHKRVEAQAVSGALQIAASFGPGEGRLFMITDHAIDKVSVTAPGRVARSKRATVEITVADTSGVALDAVVPLRIDIVDAQGKAGEFSGWHAAKGGKLTLNLDIAPNDAPGAWTVRVRELASGKTAQTTFSVQ